MSIGCTQWGFVVDPDGNVLGEFQRNKTVSKEGELPAFVMKDGRTALVVSEVKLNEAQNAVVTSLRREGRLETFYSDIINEVNVIGPYIFP